MNNFSQSQHFEPMPMADGPIDHDQNPHKANRALLATLTIAALGVAACSQESAASTNEDPVPATSEAPDSVDTTVALDTPVIITTEAPVDTEPEQETTTTTTPTTSAPTSTTATSMQPEATPESTVLPYENEVQLLANIEEKWGLSPEDVVYLPDLQVDSTYCTIDAVKGPLFTFEVTGEPYPYQHHRNNGETAIDTEYLVPSDQEGLGFKDDPNALIASSLGLTANDANYWNERVRTYPEACLGGETDFERTLAETNSDQ